MRKVTLLLLVMGIAGVVFSSWTAHACSVCGGAAIGTDPGTGFNTSILFLLSLPYVLVGTVIGWLLYTHRRALREQGRKGERFGSFLGRNRREIA